MKKHVKESRSLNDPGLADNPVSVQFGRSLDSISGDILFSS